MNIIPDPGSRSFGFTLIELMITVAIVAILAAIAYPSYNSYVQGSRRADAMTALQQIMLKQENWRVNHTAYTGTLGSGGLELTTTSPDGHYNIALSSPSGTGYTATATATGAQTADTNCRQIIVVIDNNPATNGGVPVNMTSKNAGGTTSNGCWKR